MPGVSNAAVENGAEYIKPKLQKKMAYFKHLQSAFDEYDQAFLVNADNVGSKQMQEIRMNTRDDWYVIVNRSSRLSLEYS